jgi:hypothetical protein
MYGVLFKLKIKWSFRIRLLLAVKFILVSSFPHHVSYEVALESVSANVQDSNTDFSNFLNVLRVANNTIRNKSSNVII